MINLSSDESHHLMRVLRLKAGSEVFVFDGKENEYRCEFGAVKKNRVQLRILERLDDKVESPLNLTLAQALAKGDKFDFIVQKATELGVSRIVPLASDHTDVKLTGELSAKRNERWQRLSLEALKQCGRRRLVEIAPVMTVDQLIDSLDSDRRPARLLFFNEKGGQNVEEAVKGITGKSEIVAMIGPEGGWSELEQVILRRADGLSVSLGPRILRTETAAVVAMTLLQNYMGDLSGCR
jgi:16S rRNA (uracil1498-N3)-methyltransferase